LKLRAGGQWRTSYRELGALGRTTIRLRQQYALSG
jgi:hypothetical protein